MAREENGFMVSDSPDYHTYLSKRLTSPEVGDQTTKLFVYGLLKKGFSLEYAMRDTLYLGEATVPFALYEWNEGVAAGALSQEVGWTKGELYEVSKRDLQRLDDIEGHPYHFRRMPITAVLYPAGFNAASAFPPIEYPAEVYFAPHGNKGHKVMKGLAEFLGF